MSLKKNAHDHMLLGCGILKAILETVYYEGMVASSLLLQYQHV